MSTTDAVPLSVQPSVAVAPIAVAAPVVGGGGGGGAPLEKRSTSLWVGDLAPDVTEASLSDLFSTVAAVQSARVCRSTVTRESLGYAYVNFMTPEDAEKAKEEFNYQPMPVRHCRIMFSQRDPALRRSNVGNLFIKNLDPELTSRDLHDAFKAFGTLLSVKVATDRAGVSKGYGFVHFDSEAAATKAIEGTNGVVMPGGTLAIKVEHYLPKNQRGITDRWTNVFVKNLPKAWSKEKFQEVFAPFGEITSIALPTKDGESSGHGFVNYKEHEQAVMAVSEMHGKTLEGEEPVAPSKKEVEAAAAAAAAEGGAPAPVLAPRPPKLYCARFQRKVDRQRAQKEKSDTMKRERIQRFQGCNLYVRNLDDNIDDAALRKEFEVFGAIQSARVATEDGRSKCFGFVCFSTPEEANRARETMNRKPMGASQKPLLVVLWEPKDARVARQAQAQAQRAAVPPRGHPIAPGGFGLPQAAFGQGYPNMMQFIMQFMMNPQFFQLMAQMQAVETRNRGGMGGARVPAPGMNAMNVNPQLGGRAPAAMPLQGVPYPGGPGSGYPGAAAGYPNQVNVNQLATMMQTMNASRGGAPTARTSRPAGMPGMPPQGAGARVSAPVAPGGAGVGAVRPQAMMMPGGGAAGGRGALLSAAGAAGAAARAPPANAPRPDALNLQLGNVLPAQRKNLIGERLYTQIAQKHPALAGKITGMLLEGMEEAELIFLIETPEELQNRIREAIEVLEQHKKTNIA